MAGRNWGKFINDNIVFIVGIPMIIGIHWGWWRMQQNPDLVDPLHRSELPVYTAYKKLKDKFTGDDIPHSNEDKEILKD